MRVTVHDTENLTFSQPTAQSSAYVCICMYGQLANFAQTISRFHVKQLADSVQNSMNVNCSRDQYNPHVRNGVVHILCPDKFYSYNDNSNDLCDVFLDLSALLRTKFTFYFFVIFNPNPHARSVSVCAKDPSDCTTIHGCLRRKTMKFLRKSFQVYSITTLFSPFSLFSFLFYLGYIMCMFLV